MLKEKMLEQWAEYKNETEIKVGDNQTVEIVSLIVRTYYSTGELLSAINYTNRVRDGLCLFYFKSGKVSHKSYYKNGKLDGKYFEYCEDGLINYVAEYKDDQKISSKYLSKKEQKNVEGDWI